MAAVGAETVEEIKPTVLSNEKSLLALLRLANLQLSPKITGALLERYCAAPEALFEATDRELAEIPDLDLQAHHVARLRDLAYIPTASQRRWLERSDTALLWKGHPNYPSSLLDIYDPPAILFLQGSYRKFDLTSVAIVGSRHATPYGVHVAERIARELAAYGIIVISGGARGIDAATHRGVLEKKGRTLAVLGCGPDVAYPREHRALFQAIAQQGALVSEYPPGTQPEAWRFPARNRVISGLAQAVLVVEAPINSGALITARYALEQGRSVLAVPGDINRPASAGTNALLKEGAIVVTETADVLYALGLTALAAKPRQPTLDFDTGQPNVFDTSHLNELQRKLVESLSLTPRHIDQIAQEVQRSVSEVSTEMTLLELSGFVQRLPGNTYVRGQSL
ncbi:DNA protecting protein DprA [Chthonomonas calidirosea]|nr:DNA protecting protein DprA [Chthonomonas calidirosea]